MDFARGSMEAPPASRRNFATTHWALVLTAGGTDSRAAAPALARLCEAYWYPLYAFVRRKGHDAEESIDLTQEFLTRLLERNYLRNADPSRGRFRTFLLVALERFLIDEWRRNACRKRGGGRVFRSLDAGRAEERYRLEPVDPMTPERLYERRWAMTLIEGTLERLGAECAGTGRERLFDAVKSSLLGEALDVAATARALGMRDGALKTAVHRLRRRYVDLLRTQIAATVAEPDNVEDEIRHLIQALAS